MVVTKGSGHRPPPRRVSPSRKPPTAPTTYKSILALAAARKDLSIANAVLKKTAGPDFGPNAPPATVFLPNDEVRGGSERRGWKTAYGVTSTRLSEQHLAGSSASCQLGPGGGTGWHGEVDWTAISKCGVVL